MKGRESRIARRECVEHFCRAILAAVIDEDHLERSAWLEHRKKASAQLIDRCFFVVNRNDQRNPGRNIWSRHDFFHWATRARTASRRGTRTSASSVRIPIASNNG